VFKVGDKVVSPNGIGEVVDVNRYKTDTFVDVEFEDCFYSRMAFSQDGIFETDQFPTLFKLGEQPESWKFTKTVKKYRVLARYKCGEFFTSTRLYESEADFDANTYKGCTFVKLLVDDLDFEEVEVSI